MATISLQNHLDKLRKNKGRHQPAHRCHLGNAMERSWLAFSHIIAPSLPQSPEVVYAGHECFTRNCGPETAK